jgi:hypothetical protein
VPRRLPNAGSDGILALNGGEAMSFFKKLFGGGEGKTEAGSSREYKGFTITAAPIKEAGQFRLAGIITKEINGALKEHRFVRADVFTSKDEAVQFAFMKGELIIDQSGEGIFD